MHELSSHAEYVSGEALRYCCSKSGFEVDFILDDHTALESISALPLKRFLEALWVGE